jgi:hypothetical protein
VPKWLRHQRGLGLHRRVPASDLARRSQHRNGYLREDGGLNLLANKKVQHVLRVPLVTTKLTELVELCCAILGLRQFHMS